MNGDILKFLAEEVTLTTVNELLHSPKIVIPAPDPRLIDMIGEHLFGTPPGYLMPLTKEYIRKELDKIAHYKASCRILSTENPKMGLPCKI